MHEPVVSQDIAREEPINFGRVKVSQSVEWNLGTGRAGHRSDWAAQALSFIESGVDRGHVQEIHAQADHPAALIAQGALDRFGPLLPVTVSEDDRHPSLGQDGDNPASDISGAAGDERRALGEGQAKRHLVGTLSFVSRRDCGY
jgi:hypothetical protein